MASRARFPPWSCIWKMHTSVNSQLHLVLVLRVQCVQFKQSCVTFSLLAAPPLQQERRTSRFRASRKHDASMFRVRGLLGSQLKRFECAFTLARPTWARPVLCVKGVVQKRFGANKHSESFTRLRRALFSCCIIRGCHPCSPEACSENTERRHRSRKCCSF